MDGKHDSVCRLGGGRGGMDWCRAAVRYWDTWQLVINTITNVATFVMVFLIQSWCS